MTTKNKRRPKTSPSNDGDCSLALPCVSEFGEGSWIVRDANGDILYDLIGTQSDARALCDCINATGMYEWDQIESLVEKFK